MPRRRVMNEGTGLPCPRRGACEAAAAIARDPALSSYSRVYCEGRHDRCQRVVQLAAGHDVDPRLLPDGRLLPDPEREPVAYAAARGRAPLPPDEQQRRVALLRHDVLDTPAEADLDELTALASELCGTPIALLSLVDEERQWFKSRVGLDARETPRDQAFCAHAILQDEVFEVADATEDPRFAANPLVTSDPSIRFYAGAPLVTTDGYRLGTLCVIDRVPRALSDQQRRVLRVLGRQVVAQLELRESVRVLTRQTRALQANRQELVDAFFEALEGDEREDLQRAFMSRLTHELRTPLNAIIGLSELLLEDDEEDPLTRRKDLTLINSAGRHMLELVNGMLDLAAIESGADAVKPTRFDLEQLVRDVVALLRPAARRGNNTLRATVDARVETVVSDPTKVRQILFNVLANACEYTEDGEVTLAVTRAGDERPRARFEIADSGVGMSEEQLARLFEGFTRFTDSHVRESTGTGLGMTITRALCELLGGEITVTSAPGEGTTFVVELPADGEPG
ncbi:MAG: GAF domain-containing sensor histidine kinase [Myxococcales bacterium]|nr:GAF domain-containing sensor histidine kinase [Myxococcales bacterium]